MDFSSLKIISLVLFSLFSFAYWISAFFVLYHLTRFGIGVLPKKIAAIFLLGSVILFFTSILFFIGLK